MIISQRNTARTARGKRSYFVFIRMIPFGKVKELSNSFFWNSNTFLESMLNTPLAIVQEEYLVILGYVITDRGDVPKARS